MLTRLGIIKEDDGDGYLYNKLFDFDQYNLKKCFKCLNEESFSLRLKSNENKRLNDLELEQNVKKNDKLECSKINYAIIQLVKFNLIALIILKLNII